ncbi:MAG: 6,7-dimethyl-8-ribityllumazine synthase [Planctomycetota bacterium]
MATTFEGQLSGKGLKVALVVARFNSVVGDRLLAGAVDALVRHGVDPDGIDRAYVPGAFELAPVARRLAASGRYQAVVALGAVIRGGTPHFEYVCQAAARGVADAAADAKVPITFGVLTTDSLEQALDRAGGKAGNKGAEAALAAIEMANLYRAIG